MISIQEVKLVNDIWYKLDFPGGMLGNESNTDLTSLRSSQNLSCWNDADA